MFSELEHSQRYEFQPFCTLKTVIGSLGVQLRVQIRSLVRDAVVQISGGRNENMRMKARHKVLRVPGSYPQDSRSSKFMGPFLLLLLLLSSNRPLQSWESNGGEMSLAGAASSSSLSNPSTYWPSYYHLSQ